MKIVTITLRTAWPDAECEDGAAEEWADRLANYAVDRLDASAVNATVSTRSVPDVDDSLLDPDDDLSNDENEERAEQWFERANEEVTITRP